MTQTPGHEDRDEAPGAATPPPEPVSEPREPEIEPPAPAVRRAGPGWPALAALAVLLVVLIAGVATSPFWTPAIMPLLPWAERAPPAAADYAALTTRLAAVERRPDGAPAATQRLDRLEAEAGELSASVAAAKGTLQRLEQRRGAADSQAAAAAQEQQESRQRLARLDKFATDLGDRIGRLEARLQAETGVGRADAALLLSLLQLHETVEAGRPYAAQYEGFVGLAGGQPELVAAATPLAQAAPGGVESRAALQLGLAKLADRRSTAAPPPPSSEARWWEEALSRLRELVTVRRIGAPLASGSASAVERAQAALAAGSLSGAIAAVDGLSGSGGEGARQWLKAARTRLAAEAALARLQDLLTARLAAKPGVRS